MTGLERDPAEAVDLMVSAYQWALANPDSHDQHHYARQAAGKVTLCFAGRIVVGAGYTPAWRKSHFGWGLVAFAVVEIPRTIDDLARELLGLSHDQADALFCDDNGLSALRRIIRDITGIDPADVVMGAAR